jgi:hypothetical protein
VAVFTRGGSGEETIGIIMSEMLEHIGEIGVFRVFI